MIYLDTSVLLARLLAEGRQPREEFWDQSLISSRLLEYEVWNRLHARRLAATQGESARALLGRVSFIELAQPILVRALEPFPKPVRTLDALHLATALFLKEQDRTLRLATYDRRLAVAARSLKIPMLVP